jgi:hypothetical protein
MNKNNEIKLILLLTILSIAWSLPLSPVDEINGIAITAPKPNESIRGNFAISGSTEISGFSGFELSFAYNSTEKTTWFPIAVSTSRVKDGILAYWNTESITDGMYQLRLRVILNDGNILEELITPVIIQNDTPVASISPLEVGTAGYLLVTEGATVTPAPTATKIAENPIIISNGKMETGLVFGVSGVIILVLSGMIYSRLRKQ